MNILITGVAGFIGFNCAKSLLKKKIYKVYGIDNYDNYYSQKIKKKKEYLNYQLVKIFILKSLILKI